MKKHFISIVAGLTLLVCETSAGTGEKIASSNSPAAQDLRKAQPSIKLKPLESLVMRNSYKERKEVSINWHKVVVVFSEMLLRIKNDPNSRDRHYTPGEILQLFTDEIRQTLEAFEERYNVRVIWKTPNPDVPDATAEFLHYADTPQSQKDICRMYRVQELSKAYMDIVELSKKLKEKEKSK